ncbi:hypothetical protein FJZ19_04130 [Candidatus Pacearchaeota archaeon]|nr:hypothetical protein [Candidatus Pacearchaeota archaeon]
MPFGGGFRRGGFRRNFPREMTKIKCAECGKEDEVPFKPREGSKVLCKECFMKSKGITPRQPKKEEAEESEESEEESESEEDMEEAEEEEK